MSIRAFSQQSAVGHIDQASVTSGGDNSRATRGLTIQKILRAEPDTLPRDIWKNKRLCTFLILKDPDNFKKVAMCLKTKQAIIETYIVSLLFLSKKEGKELDGLLTEEIRQLYPNFILLSIRPSRASRRSGVCSLFIKYKWWTNRLS